MYLKIVTYPCVHIGCKSEEGWLHNDDLTEENSIYFNINLNQQKMEINNQWNSIMQSLEYLIYVIFQEKLVK